MLPPFIDTLWNASAFPLLSIINWTKYKYLLPLQHEIMKKVKNSEEKDPVGTRFGLLTKLRIDGNDIKEFNRREIRHTDKSDGEKSVESLRSVFKTSD